MIVLDASTLVELVLNTPTGQLVVERIGDAGEGLHIPHLADVEVIQTLRTLVHDRDLMPDDAAHALADFRALDLQRHAHEPLLDRVWELRDSLTAYDAVYVALAEALGCRVLTCDRPFSRSPAAIGRVVLVAPDRDKRT